VPSSRFEHHQFDWLFAARMIARWCATYVAIGILVGWPTLGAGPRARKIVSDPTYTLPEKARLVVPLLTHTALLWPFGVLLVSIGDGCDHN
jgi:hypothetical protein